MKFNILLFWMFVFFSCTINIVEAVDFKTDAFELVEDASRVAENVDDDLNIEALQNNSFFIEMDVKEKKRIIKLVENEYHIDLMKRIKRSNQELNETLSDFLYLTIVIVFAYFLGMSS